MSYAADTAVMQRPRQPGGTGPRRLVIVGIDMATQRRLEGAVARARWQCATVERIAEGQHVAGASGAMSLVIDGSLASEKTVERLARQNPAVGLFVWASGASSELQAQWLLAGVVDVLTPRMGDAELFARMSRGTDGRAADSHQSTVGPLSVDSFRGEVTWRGARMPLTGRERDVLHVLVIEQGKTLRREVIYQRVWAHTMPAGDRNVDVNVKRLRTKLATATGGSVSIETVSRVGYRLDVSDDAPTIEQETA